jgi:tight adherence protein B
MDPNLLLLVIYLAVALIAATALLLTRDLLARRRKPENARGEQPLDLASLLPPTEAAATAARDESWLGRLAVETGYGFTGETALLLATMIGLAVGGGLFVWRDDLMAGITGAVMGVLTVGGLLFFLRFRRYRAIREQLPDVMELMARAVRAGESLDQAIALAGNSGLRPVAAEFRYCASQMKMGLSLESAIRGMVARAPLAETRILAMTLIVQRRRGGSLPTTLERLARVFRDRSNFFRQFQAATALGRGSAALIALIAVGLDAFVIFGNSEYAQSLLTTNTGRIMLALALVLQIIGITWAVWLFRSHY